MKTAKRLLILRFPGIEVFHSRNMVETKELPDFFSFIISS